MLVAPRERKFIISFKKFRRILMDRKDFLKKMGIGMAGSFFLASQTSGLKAKSTDSKNDLFFKISLAEWSYHKTLFAGKMKNLDFPVKAREEFGIDAVEYVNQFFKDKAKDKTYLKSLNKRADDHGVNNVLIMIDGEGDLGVTDSKERKQAVDNHHKWVDAAAYLGCFAIRVNARGKGTPQEVADAAVQSLNELTEYAAPRNINIIVENHGGYSSNGQWMASVMKRVNNPHCGTLPDLGNFDISETETYNRYKGVREMMPFAKDVSAKTYDFDDEGNETTIDYRRMLKIVKDAGYRDYLGIEYEGDRLSEPEGIRASLNLLKRVGAELS